eukprot:SAG11_NODE_1950_length_4013_cov_4.004854_5_plen_98_part_00
MATSRATIKILQDHYPERLHCAIMVEAPGIFRVAWTALSPFIDPITKAKVEWCTGSPEQRRALLQRHALLSQLCRSIGGESDDVFEPGAYLAADPWR